MTKQKDLIKNTLIIAFGKLSTQFLTFLLLPLYTTYLATSEFGTVDLIMTYVVLLAPVITISLEMGIFRFLIDARGDAKEQTSVVSAAFRVIAAMMALAAILYLITQLFVDIPYGVYAIGAIAAIIAANMFLQIARGLGDNVKFAIGGVVAGVTTIVANVVFIVVMGMGAEGMLLATILANVACVVYLFFALRLYRYIDLTLSDQKLTRKLLGYSAPLVPNGISWWVINAADRTIVTIILGVASNGIYAVAYKFPLIFNGLFSFFGMSWTESASMHINSPDRDKFFSQTMNASVKLFGSLGIIMIAGIPLVFSLIVGEAFREAYMYIPVLIIGSFFNSIVGLYSAIYIAKKMTRQVMSTSIIAAVVSIVTTLVGIHFIGLFAPAVAMAVAFLAMAVYRHYDMKKYVTITYDARVFLLLALLYAFTTTLYYFNSMVGNIVNAVVTTGLVILFNKSIVSALKNKLANRRSLSPEQEVAEELEEGPR